MDSSIGLILLQIGLIALNSIFACAETAIISMSDTKLAKLASNGDKRAKHLSKLTAHPVKFLATLQVAITLSGFLGSAFAAKHFSDKLVNWFVGLGVTMPRNTLDTITVVLITLVLSYITLLFGELLPKRLAARKAEQWALRVSGLMRFVSKLFTPVVWLLSVSTNLVLRLMRIDPNEENEEVSEEEIRMMVDAGSEKGTIDHQEKEFIQNVFEFDDLTAEEIATHRTDVDLLWLEEDMDAWAETIHNTRHTLYPICEESADHITGILNAKDYFRLENKSRENVLEMAVKAPYFVPENIKADVLFRNMRQNRTAMAIVLDEYGGMVGIVTMNDLLEQLVGNLEDENDVPDEDISTIEPCGENMWKIHGNLELSELEKATGVEIECEDYGTFTGLVFNVLEIIPGDGPQSIDLEIDPFIIHVSRVQNHQVWESTIQLKNKPETNDENEEE